MFRTGFHDVDQASFDFGLDTGSDTKVQQQFAEECDINNIVGRFLRTGEFPDAKSIPQYGDFTAAVGFRESLDLVRQARDGFMRLDPKIRERFGHDPEQLMVFLADASNRKEAEDLGLVERAPERPREDPKVDQPSP